MNHPHTKRGRPCRKIVFLAVVGFAGWPVPLSFGQPEAGDPAPPIRLARLLQGPDGADTSWEALRGKVVVLEFWATWCGPCVSSIPGMNKLQAAHKNDPIVFIHVTDEDESVVRKFLERTPIDGWVGIDDDRTTFKAYGIGGLPRVVVVDKDGTLLGWSDPRFLAIEPEKLNDVLATGNSSGLGRTQRRYENPLAGVSRDESTGGEARNLCDIVIRRSDESSAKRRGGGDSRGWWSFDRPLERQVSLFCRVPPPRLVAEVPLPEEHYDVIALTRGEPSPRWSDAVCRLIGATFGLSMSYEKRLTDVYVLKMLPERELTVTPSWGGVYYDQDRRLSAPSKDILERMKKGETFFSATCPLTWLADTMSNDVGKPVVAELGSLPEEYPEFYAICFPYEKGNVQSLIRGLEKHTGLTLVPDRREIEVLVVDKSEQALLTPFR